MLEDKNEELDQHSYEEFHVFFFFFSLFVVKLNLHHQSAGFQREPSNNSVTQEKIPYFWILVLAVIQTESRIYKSLREAIYA